LSFFPHLQKSMWYIRRSRPTAKLYPNYAKFGASSGFQLDSSGGLKKIERRHESKSTKLPLKALNPIVINPIPSIISQSSDKLPPARCFVHRANPPHYDPGNAHPWHVGLCIYWSFKAAHPQHRATKEINRQVRISWPPPSARVVPPPSLDIWLIVAHCAQPHLLLPRHRNRRGEIERRDG